MAVTVENTGATATATAANTIALTKPTGLATGDLMIAHVYARSNDSTTFNSVASGFTEIQTLFASSVAHGAWWKIADAGDVAASDFTFGWDGVAVNGIGRMWRISGHDATTPINGSNEANGVGSTDTVSGITPSVANCLLILLHGASDDTGSISGWAIATDNPASWTEAYDDNGGLPNALIAGAYALRPQTTATGDATWTAATAENWGAMIIAVAPSGGGGGRTTKNTRAFPLGLEIGMHIRGVQV